MGSAEPLAASPGPLAASPGPLAASPGPLAGSPELPLDVNGRSGLPPGRPPVRRDRPGRRRLGVALRRLMVTPTFAAGLGVVVAASLAVNMTKTVLHFSSPVTGQCTAASCHPQPAPGGTLASARPGVHMTPHRPATGSGQPRHAGDRPGNAVDQPAQPGSPVVITYQLTQRWPGGFADQITVGGLGHRGGWWQLALSYPGARIAGVQGVAWNWRSADSGVAQGQNASSAADQWGGGEPSGPTGTVRFVVTVDGRSQPPSGCALNGVPCSFTQAPGPN